MRNDAIDDVQSGEETKEQIIKFVDHTPGASVAIDDQRDLVSRDVSVELADFLSRPALIGDTTWTEGAALSWAIDPWYAFFNKSYIKKKLDNYAFIRCKLHIKVVINASPFYYGCARLSYRPLTSFNAGRATGGTADRILINESQRPGFWIHVENSQGGEIELPFLYYKNWLKIGNGADFTDMGKITIRSAADLLNANAVAGQAASIVMYAWATDVELAAPTVNLALQAKDEYENSGTISKPASAIAHATGLLGKVPVIGPFMTATSIASSAVGSIASLFGWTNVPVIDDVKPFKSMINPGLASTEIGWPAEKLTLDPKNELTVDPTICGDSNNDCMSVATIASRESYFETFTWASSKVVDDLLFSIRINPDFYQHRIVTGETEHFRTPICHISRLFEYWKGSIVLRFQVVASQYHRGRLRFSWDPYGDLSNTTDSSTTAYNKIVDITTEKDVIIRIPYLQDKAWKQSETTVSAPIFSPTAQTYSSVYDNGTMSVRVLTAQTSPVASADINVVCSVYAGDDFQVAGPKDVPTDDHFFTIQSQDIFEQSEQTGNDNLSYMGEVITSLRQYLRRSALSRILITEATTYAPNAVLSTMARTPLQSGYDPNGIHTAEDYATTGTYTYNFVNNTPFNYLAPCYVGQRGSHMWTFHALSQDVVTLRATRSINAKTAAGYREVQDGYNPAASISERERHMVYNVYDDGGMAGQAVTSTGVQPSLSVVAPFYNNNKMVPCDANSSTLGNATYDMVDDALKLQVTSATNTVNYVEMYHAIGTDFTFIHFLNVPMVYIYPPPFGT